jgi:phage gpG-like protein
MVTMDVQIYRDEASKMLKRLRQRMPTIDRVIRGAIADSIVGHVQKNKLRGQVLHRKTGDLASHLTWRHVSEHETAVGVYGVIYARIHELGGTIRPKTAGGALRFRIGNQWIVAKLVRMPKRSYLVTGIQDFFRGGDESRAVALGERIMQRELKRLEAAS